jgi:anti-sigma factor ChrR (cupin superfamily)
MNLKLVLITEHLDAHEDGPEQVYVLSGIFNDGREDHQAGTFLHHPKGSAHVPQSKVWMYFY